MTGFISEFAQRLLLMMLVEREWSCKGCGKSGLEPGVRMLFCNQCAPFEVAS